MRNIDVLILLSTYGENAEHVASRRIRELAKSAKHLGVKSILITQDWGIMSRVDNVADVVIRTSARRHVSANLLLQIGQSIFWRKDGKSSVQSTGEHSRGHRRTKLLARALIDLLLTPNFNMSPSKAVVYRPRKKEFRRRLFQLIERCHSSSRIALFSTALPPFVHELGAQAKRRYPDILWIADYRDPLRNSTYKPGAYRYAYRGYVRRIDRTVAIRADLITAASRGVMNKVIHGNERIVPGERRFVLYNGVRSYSGPVLDRHRVEAPRARLAYTGSLSARQDPEAVIRALPMVESTAELHYAGADSEILRAKNSVPDLVRDHGMVSHEEALRLQQGSDILLVIKSDQREDGVLTGKFFEYLSAGKPILVVGKGDVELNVLAADITGIRIVPHDSDEIASTISALLKSVPIPRKDEISKYEWVSQTEALFERLAELPPRKT